MAKFFFRHIAIRETEHWRLERTAVKGMEAFGIYLFREGEATFCCSLTPSSWCEHLETEFMNVDGTESHHDLPEEEREKVDEMARMANVDETGSYYSFWRKDRRDLRFVSKRILVEVDIREHKTAENTWAEARIAAGEAAWEEARETFSGNGRESIPVIDRPYCFRDFQREQAPRVIPTLPLFSGRMEG